jgi:hypothetical protein
MPNRNIDYLNNDPGADEADVPLVMTTPEDPWKERGVCHPEHNCIFLNPLSTIPEMRREEEQAKCLLQDSEHQQQCQQSQQSQKDRAALIDHYNSEPIREAHERHKIICNKDDINHILLSGETNGTTTIINRSPPHPTSDHSVVSGGWYGLALSITEDHQHYAPRHGICLGLDEVGATQPVPPREHHDDSGPWAELRDPHQYDCSLEHRRHRHHHQYQHHGQSTRQIPHSSSTQTHPLLTRVQRQEPNTNKRQEQEQEQEQQDVDTCNNRGSNMHHHTTHPIHSHPMNHLNRPCFHPHYHFHGTSNPLSYSRNELVSIHEVDDKTTIIMQEDKDYELFYDYPDK